MSLICEIKASVIIPTYNRCRSLERALQSVMQLDFPREQFEVVIVDNNSSDDTPRVSSNFSIAGIPLKYVKETRLSFTVARHTGAETASGAILSYIDDDVIVSPGWLTAIVATFEKYDSLGIVGGPILPIFESEPPEWIQRCHPMSGWLSLLDLGPDQHETQDAYGPNFSVRKDVLQLVGGFPADTIGVEAEGRRGVVEKIYVGMGDVGLCAKVRKAGYKVMYVPEALVHHVIPPVRLTKKWWHSRLTGEGCCNALSYQYEHKEGSLRLLSRSLLSLMKAAKHALLFAICAIEKTGKERHEFDISYHLSRAKVEFLLARKPDLAQRLWGVALTGVQPEDTGQLSRFLS
jgi:GT2 family glycosyltransferase